MYDRIFRVYFLSSIFPLNDAVMLKLTLRIAHFVSERYFIKFNYIL